MTPPRLAIVIPAYNEAGALPATLAAIGVAIEHAAPHVCELIVVDNGSTDGTAEVASRLGATVVFEEQPGIARARNAGAERAIASALLFVDADTHVPTNLVIRVLDALSDPSCVGGAPATEYRYSKRILRPYMAMWSLVARLRKMSQGVAQFVTAEAFSRLGGYDERLHMAEDTDFYWRLQRLASARQQHVTYLSDAVVIPSSRRLDDWPAWRTILYTNPLTTRMFLRSRRFWRGWREDTVR